MVVGGHRLDIGALVLGGILVFVGIWYLLKNAFGFEMPDIDWDMVWPVLIIALGAGIALRALARSDTPRS